MSLSKEILRITARYHPIGYKQLFEYLYGETVYGKKINQRSVRVIVGRLEKRGFLETSKSQWSATPSGKRFLSQSSLAIKKFFDKNKVLDNREKPRNLIIIFDIPEKKKRYRDWLRMELVGFGFTLIQKSVWLGPGLPQEFIEYLNEAGILKFVRFFRATEKELI